MADISKETARFIFAYLVHKYGGESKIPFPTTVAYSPSYRTIYDKDTTADVKFPDDCIIVKVNAPKIKEEENAEQA